MESIREEEEEGRALKVRALIEDATNSTSPEIDPRILKAIKTVVRYSDSELRLAAQMLMDLMKRDHSQVRYLSLLIIDELFMRSKLFRTIVVENFDQLLTLSVGFRRNLPLPAPQAVATRLRKTAIEFLEKWNDSFGVQYRHLRLGFDYLKNTLRLQFPNLQSNAARVQQERREREMRTQDILRNKFESLRLNFSLIKEEIKSTTDETEQCLDIASSKEELPCNLMLDDEDFEEFRSSELRQLRLDSIKEGEKVHENTENKVVFDALRELYKLLTTKHLVTVQEWISVLIRVEAADNRFRDSMLKEFIDIRNSLVAVKKKCEESGFTPADEKEEDEDIWEEYKVGLINVESSSKNSDIASTSGNLENARKKENPKGGSKSRKTIGSLNIPSSVRTELLAEAPVIELGSRMYTWESESKSNVLANQRGMEFESHWGRVDYDAVIPADKIAQLNLQATFYKEEPVEIQPCRAPLSKGGGLCQRRDLKVCPFHGPKVSRDDNGNPITENSSTTSDLESDSDFIERLAKQAVKNVRDKDEEREIDRRSLKRAKLAKVREHNEEVLRDAAIASTSRSANLGEEHVSLARNKKETLASMLRKKVTAKDRISQKLSNTRGKTVKKSDYGW